MSSTITKNAYKHAEYLLNIIPGEENLRAYLIEQFVDLLLLNLKYIDKDNCPICNEEFSNEVLICCPLCNLDLICQVKWDINTDNEDMYNKMSKYTM